MQRIPQIWPGWQAEELIGRGGFGSVYRASRTVGGLTSVAAIKIIEIPNNDSEVTALTNMGMDALSIRSYFEETAQSVMREIAVMDALKGAPGIVHIEDYQMLEREDGVGWSIFIRMELLEALPAYITRAGMPDARETAKIGVDICRGLAYCHEKGIIHRDVKPENVFRTPYGEYKLGDFGLARRITEGSHSTMSHAGTGPFMAPEVESGHYDARVDTYSLGIMLYRWLNGGKPPFVGPRETPNHASLEKASLRRLTGERPPLPAGAGVDPALAALVLRAVEPKPADRWPSAAALGEALQGWLDGAPAGSAPAQATAPAPAQAQEPSDYNPLSTLDKVGAQATKTQSQVSPAAEAPSSSQVAQHDALQDAIDKVKPLWRAYVNSVDWYGGRVDLDIWDMSEEPFEAVFEAIESLEAALDDMPEEGDKEALRGNLKGRRIVSLFKQYAEDHSTSVQQHEQRARELSGALGVTFPEKKATSEKQPGTDATSSVEKTPEKRSGGMSATSLIVRLVLTAIVGYLIYLIWHFTLDDAFEAAHPVLHWFITLHGAFWWIVDPLLVGACWVNWWED